MTDYEIRESQYMSAKDYANAADLSIELLTEIKTEQTTYGPKPTGQVNVSNGISTEKKTMRFNQTMMNHFIRTTNKKSSAEWVGMKFPIKVDSIKGNLTFLPKV